jgi:hypothetical protein
MERNELEPEEEQWLRFALAKFLEIPVAAVCIVRKEPANSVRLTVMVPEEAGRLLRRAFDEGDPRLFESLSPMTVSEIVETASGSAQNSALPVEGDGSEPRSSGSIAAISDGPSNTGKSEGLAQRSSVTVDTDNVKELLRRVESGDQSAVQRLYPLVEAVLREIAAARKREGGSAAEGVPTTQLIDNAFRESLGSASGGWDAASRRTFYALASRSMQDMLIDQLRRTQAEPDSVYSEPPERDQAEGYAFLWGRWRDPDFQVNLREKLNALRARGKRDTVAEVVFRMRWFLGCKLLEVAEILGMAYADVFEAHARTILWLRIQLSSSPDVIA